ncbi:MAG: peptidoglycan DD-metalloendopeptidase family protein [Clostridiales bacterium]|jgi:murein DD-endopeptidase MepM/ murein hydrolase activator NlpD|nr:peptidoglycan DD-metalloendopeptidase family protein [Clostridiales bacterium]
MKVSKRTAAAVVMAAVMALSGATAYAVTQADIDKLKERYTEAERKKESAQSLLDDTNREKSALLLEVAALDAELESALAELDLITAELANTRESLAQARIQLGEAEADRAKQYETLKARLRVMYENGDSGYIDLLFESADLSEMMNRYEYMSRIIDFDRGVFDKLIATERDIAETLAEIDAREKEQAVLEASQIEKSIALEDSIASRNDRVAELRKDADLFAQQAADMASESDEITAAIRSAEKTLADAKAAAELARKAAEAARKAAEAAQNAANAAGNAAENTAQALGPMNGVLRWPIEYYVVSSGYGNRTGPIDGEAEFHTGLDIPAPTGTSVHAAQAGTVIIAKYWGGYGNAVVIDHGGSVSTLYGHNSRLLVSVGDWVEKGDAVAEVGSTGYSTGPHCHFEVRVDGVHTDPWNFLR